MVNRNERVTGRKITTEKEEGKDDKKGQILVVENKMKKL